MIPITDHVPMYMKIKMDLTRNIKEGMFKPGDKIYSENEIKKIYGVSSATAVKAITEMVNEGYLYRIQGKGTFVSKPKLIKKMNTPLSFTEELKKRGIDSKVKIISVEEVVDENVAECLKVKENELLCKIVRLRLADGEPISVETSFFPTYILSKEDALLLEKVESLYALLKQVKNIEPFHAKQVYTIQYCDQVTSRLLEQQERQANFFAKRTAYTEDDIPFEYSESYIRWDRYSIEFNLKRDY